MFILSNRLNMNEAQQEILANFLAITGSNEAEANGMLAACDYNLETAVGLFFAAADGGARILSRSGKSIRIVPCRPRGDGWRGRRIEGQPTSSGAT